MIQEPNSTKKGLYTPQLERDSCGVGMLADLTGTASYSIVNDALKMLENMEHRGACGCEQNTGDGAGILVQIPHVYFSNFCQSKNILLPDPGRYGVGMFFLPRDKEQQEFCLRIIQAHSRNADFQVLVRRNVPVDSSMIGQSALDSEPTIVQLFFKTMGFNYKELERRFYFLRSSIMKEIYDTNEAIRDEFYISSLSSKTIVYKGLLMATQLRQYYKDLQSPNFRSAVAIVHSRFSTNTVPMWKLAQPFRCIAHNGEINTIQGNINWWKARENKMKRVSMDRPDLAKIFPVCDPYISDSGNFDNVVDFLLRASRSIPHSIMMMIPEAWQNDKSMPAFKRAFYEYHDAVMEPWDGPASICFTDGTILGATLDRFGLRPSRYLITSDNRLILASEAGCLEVDPEKIVKKGRLEPGKMLVADLDEKRIYTDDEVKEAICKRKPYGEWLDRNALHIDELSEMALLTDETLPLKKRQIAFGFSLEDEQLILDAMVQNAKEPIGSMGADIPLAVLSKIAQHVSNYFKQQFAQVTNPPIDPLREDFYMSLSSAIGGGSDIIGIGEKEARVLRFDSPILTQEQFQKILGCTIEAFESVVLDITYEKGTGLQVAIQALCEQAHKEIISGKKVICLSDIKISATRINIPSLIITGALHHFLISEGLRREVAIVVNAGDIWETHHSATLLSYGADLICPYLALKSAGDLAKNAQITIGKAKANYIKAVNKGLMKVMSKLGISTVSSYRGAQTFEALGISQEVVNICFKGTITRIGGMTFEDLEKENLAKHDLSFNTTLESIPDLGNYQWKRRGEYHLFNPQSIHLLQHSTKTKNYEVYKRFTDEIDRVEKNSGTLRSYLKIRKGKAIPLEQVESRDSILKRFATGAMSFGSISHEAHTTLAIAMNRIGGKSNSGEGGEDESRFLRMPNGDWQRSAIKQIASGRFGVTMNYLTNADELQIKMAQGAKPGEGGQLPGHKVDKNIARVRHSTPGVGLISPPPHHDIYSIEDLAQLIFDLKNANERARIGVKLVSKAGVGVIASGVTKAHADHILISGCDGGTGASPLSSIRHAGLPWELGLSETHQSLVKNGLRDRVVLQTDGQIRTGRDLAIASMLGAEEWGIATAALVVEGCILMRKCHLNTCPVGIATQDLKLRKKFAGKVEHVVNYFHFLADQLREIMAQCGIRTVNEMVGRTDLLEIDQIERHWKTRNLDLSAILFKEENMRKVDMYATQKQDHGLEEILDRHLIAAWQKGVIQDQPFAYSLPIQSTDRAVGTMLSNEITRKYGPQGLALSPIQINFKGSAGQSFGAFTVPGLNMNLEGEANDYFGKGLSGAKLSVYPDTSSKFYPSRNIIVGNVALYGATSGEVYINGKAGDRFCVRNSGAIAVVEGVGHNGCEYMTGGTVLVLGSAGRNFAAGMSGGTAFLYDVKPANKVSINREMVLLELPDQSDLVQIKELLQNHRRLTGSVKARDILKNWKSERSKFIKVMPIEYKKSLAIGVTTSLSKAI